MKERIIVKEFKYIITDAEGIHARPAGELVKEAKNFTSAVKVTKGGKSADAKKIFGLMGLGVKQGEEIQVQIEGEDEEQAAAALEAFLKANM